MSPQASIRRGSRLRVVAALVILVGGLGTIVAARQQTTPFEQILAQLARLQASVDALAPSAESAVAFTPVVQLASGVASCSAVNVTNSLLEVEMVARHGTSGNPFDVGTFPIAPGSSAGIVVNVVAVGASPIYCEFTVLDGTKSDIRARIALSQSTTGQTELALPAE